MIEVKKQCISEYTNPITQRCMNWDLSSNAVTGQDYDTNLSCFLDYVNKMKQMADVLEKYKHLLNEDMLMVRHAASTMSETDHQISRSMLKK